MRGSWPDVNRALNSQHCVPGKCEGIEQARRWEGGAGGWGGSQGGQRPPPHCADNDLPRPRHPCSRPTSGAQVEGRELPPPAFFLSVPQRCFGTDVVSSRLR